MLCQCLCAFVPKRQHAHKHINQKLGTFTFTSSFSLSFSLFPSPFPFFFVPFVFPKCFHVFLLLVPIYSCTLFYPCLCLCLHPRHCHCPCPCAFAVPFALCPYSHRTRAPLQHPPLLPLYPIHLLTAFTSRARLPFSMFLFSLPFVVLSMVARNRTRTIAVLH